MSDFIEIAHGGGGWLTEKLIEQEILPRFGDGPLASLGDSSILPPINGQLAFTTDSFVVQPWEFSGGNIGSLAVYGVVNDLLVSGSRPLWLSLGLILEEGLPLPVLRSVLNSIRQAAVSCGVKVVTGDTKVVARGQGDGIYISMAGIGERLPEFSLSRDSVVAGDVVLVSGPLGDHGMAIVAAREKLALRDGPVSDSASLQRLVLRIKDLAGGVKFMRDPTRGGLAMVLNEACKGQSWGVLLEEKNLPWRRETASLAEVMGIDLLYVASEGRLVLVCEEGVATEILARWRQLPEGQDAALVGVVLPSGGGRVVLNTVAGTKRFVEMPRGELLPRIC